MNRIGWIVVLVLLLIVYGVSYVYPYRNYRLLQMADPSSLWEMIYISPHIILGCLLFGLTAKQIYDADN